MWSPFSLGHADEFSPPAVPSDIFPDDDARDAAMCDAGVPLDSDADVDDDSIGNDSVDSDNDESSGGGGSLPPRVRDWQEVNYGRPPTLSVDAARNDVLEQFLHEHSFIRLLINNIDKNKDISPVDKIISILYGPKSDVFRVFQDNLDLNYEQFSRFLASFYMSCKWSMNWRAMWNNKDLNTSGRGFMPPDEMDKIWDKINNFHHGTIIGDETFWQLLEDACNKTYKKFIPKKGEHKLNITLDDDKAHFNR